MLANPMIAVGAAAVALGVHVYNLGQENAAASGRVLDFNEVIDAQNTLINDGVRGLMQRGQLLRETFALESEGETIVALERQLAASTKNCNRFRRNSLTGSLTRRWTSPTTIWSRCGWASCQPLIQPRVSSAKK